VIEHGEDAMVSAAIVDGAVPVMLIRYCTDPADGWWVLAAEDLPMPPVEDLRYVCMHCLLELLDPEVEDGLEAARQDAADHDSDVGLAVWHEGRWAVCNEALDVLEGLGEAE
jgi:hypothetical protein